MSGLVEGFAATLGWRICPRNVIVEGTSDVRLLTLAARLYLECHNVAILGDQLAILHPGSGDDGGVDGLNRRLNAARQISDADRGPDGGLRYRFIGLYDNDDAGRRSITSACNFDRRLRRFADLFLLHPIMPLASGVGHQGLQQRFEKNNAAFKGLDWEVEDLLSESLVSAFEAEYPAAVRTTRELGGRKHRELTRDGKHHLHKFVEAHAMLSDLREIVILIRALRDYVHLQSDHIIC